MAKRCKYCGSKMNLNSSVCPKCGKTNNKDEKITIEEKKNNYSKYSIIGLCISLFSVLLNLFQHGWIMLALLGIIVSYIGLNDIRSKNLNGKYLTYAGIILGILSTLYCLLFWW